MTFAASFRSGKTRHRENFPVASRLIAPCHRGAILAFYEFARTADDVADHPTLAPTRKLALLDSLEATLVGDTDTEPEALALRRVLAERALDAAHAQDLLTAFRLDVIKRRYRTWDELVRYCRHSAMPAGRFVLDVHGQPRDLWPASDALCTALQIINHIQDCGHDFRALDRVYLPLDEMARHGAEMGMLDAPVCAPALRAAIDDLLDRVQALLVQSGALAASVGQGRLALEIAVIQRLAGRLVHALRGHDPLAGRVRLNTLEMMGFGLLGLLRGARHFIPLASHANENANPHTAGTAAAKASGSTFYRAMAILPSERRRAIFEIYAFCRAVDDIADAGDCGRDERLARLAEWRRDIDAVYDGTPSALLVHRSKRTLQPSLGKLMHKHRASALAQESSECVSALAGLASAVRAFALRREDFHAVLDGMEMDAVESIRAPRLDSLDLYCDRVASAVGRLCVRIFGMDDGAGMALARHLGRALQFTNILRDLDEDAAAGRLYLPREFLSREGIMATEPGEVLSHPALSGACHSLADKAYAHFAAADAILAASPRAVVRAPRVMAEAYRSILDRLVRRGWEAPRAPVRLGRGQIAWIVMRRFVW